MIYMDAFGVRPGLEAMASRLASDGFRVLLPDLYYHAGPQKPFDPATAFAGGPDKDRLMGLYQSLNQQRVMADTAAWLEFLANEPSVTGKVGCVGYCMGGAHMRSPRRDSFRSASEPPHPSTEPGSPPISPIARICSPPK